MLKLHLLEAEVDGCDFISLSLLDEELNTILVCFNLLLGGHYNGLTMLQKIVQPINL